MPQLHFTVDEGTARRLREQAQAEGTTLSRFLARLVEERLSDRWPDGYLTAVIGSCADGPIVEPKELETDDVSL
jgi:hypothetical protein